jgi:hypothetical protein
MQALARATKEVVRQAATRGFAAGAYPERKVAVLGAAGALPRPRVFQQPPTGPPMRGWGINPRCGGACGGPGWEWRRGCAVISWSQRPMAPMCTGRGRRPLLTHQLTRQPPNLALPLSCRRHWPAPVPADEGARELSLHHCPCEFPAAPLLPAPSAEPLGAGRLPRRCCCFASSLPPLPPACPAVLQLSPYVSELALYDIAGTPGVAADVSHINSKATVKGYAGAAPAAGTFCPPGAVRSMQ